MTGPRGWGYIPIPTPTQGYKGVIEVGGVVDWGGF